MPTTRSPKGVKQLGDTQVPLSISFDEYLNLKSQVAELQRQVETKDALIAELQKQLHDLTDPKRQADAKAYRKARGLS